MIEKKASAHESTLVFLLITSYQVRAVSKCFTDEHYDLIGKEFKFPTERNFYPNCDTFGNQISIKYLMSLQSELVK